MSYLDYIFIGVIALSGIVAFRRGLIKTIYSFFSLGIGIGVAYFIYPYISNFLLKNTGLYLGLVHKIIKNLKLDQLAQNSVTQGDQINMMNQLKVPQFLKVILTENKNSEVYHLLKATKVEEYIGGTIATIAMNAITFLAVLFICMILLRIVSKALDIVSKLPVLHQLNKAGGLFLGLIQGVIFVWIICIGLSVVMSLQANNQLLQLLEKSPFANFCYNHNLLINAISNITTIFLN